MSQVAYIDPARCDRSPLCPAMRRCPQKAISQEKTPGLGSFFRGGTSKVDPARCTGCTLCVDNCPARAITMAAAGK